MTKMNIVLVLVLVGCGTVPTTYVDGAVPDARVVSDAGVEDANTAVEADAGDSGHAAEDAGRTDSAVADAGTTDAGVDASSDDAGMSTPSDGGTDAAMDSGSDAAVMPSAVVEIGVAGDGSCLLTSDHAMWCWGYGVTTPTFVSNAVDIEGTCGIAPDGHAFCWQPWDSEEPEVVAYPGTDVAVLGVQAFAARPSGEVRGLGLGTVAPFTPASAVAMMPAQFCAISINGGLTCWDWSISTSTFTNFWEAVADTAPNDVTDVARRGSFGSETSIVCYASNARPSVQCFHTRGLASTSVFQYGTEVEIDGGRACVVAAEAPVGEASHPAGVYCTSDHPLAFGHSGNWPLEPLPATDMYMNTYTNAVGHNLALGANHACIMQGSSIMCWGDNRRGQLGDGTTVSSRTPQSIMW